MVMLTQVLRFEVRDETGRRAPVADLAIALLDDDYPPVTHIYFGLDDQKRRVDWGSVTDLDVRERTIRVNDIDAAQQSEKDESEVLLKRDILDSLILDLMGRRTTRVCDLLLSANDGQLRVEAADAGLLAMLRRIFKGRWPEVDRDSMFE